MPSATHSLGIYIRHTACAYYFAYRFIGVENVSRQRSLLQKTLVATKGRSYRRYRTVATRGRSYRRKEIAPTRIPPFLLILRYAFPLWQIQQKLHLQSQYNPQRLAPQPVRSGLPSNRFSQQTLRQSVVFL